MRQREYKTSRIDAIFLLQLCFFRKIISTYIPDVILICEAIICYKFLLTIIVLY
jgi:hypothetical protein